MQLSLHNSIAFYSIEKSITYTPRYTRPTMQRRATNTHIFLVSELNKNTNNLKWGKSVKETNYRKSATPQ